MENKYSPPPAYPLKWPDGRPRTQRYRVARARFETTTEQARILLGDEVRRLGGRLPVLTTNVQLRQDGHPCSNRRPPDDCGVAVYFVYKGKSMCFACDRWDRVEHNIKAIAKTIEALRGIERWGTGDALERAINAFEALPEPDRRETWWNVLGIFRNSTEAEVKAAWRLLATTYHPDKQGGSQARMSEINAARDEAIKEIRNR